MVFGIAICTTGDQLSDGVVDNEPNEQNYEFQYENFKEKQTECILAALEKDVMTLSFANRLWKSLYNSGKCARVQLVLLLRRNLQTSFSFDSISNRLSHQYS